MQDSALQRAWRKETTSLSRSGSEKEEMMGKPKTRAGGGLSVEGSATPEPLGRAPTTLCFLCEERRG